VQRRGADGRVQPGHDDRGPKACERLRPTNSYRYKSPAIVSRNHFLSTIAFRKTESMLSSFSSLINARLSRRGQRPLLSLQAGELTRSKTARGAKS
jgi:hypothetical protein